MQIDLRLLPSFVVLAEELHFSRAAERLAIAQPALSQQIRRLETQVGVRLFERDARSVELSPAGRALLAEARTAVHAAERGVAAARAAAQRSAQILRIAADLDLPGRTLACVHAFAAAHADVDVRVARMHQGQALTALHAGEVDLVVGWERMPYGPPVRTLAVDAVEIAAVVHRDHPESGRETMPREVFARHPFVLFRRESSPDVFDWLAGAATGRQHDQVEIREVSSLEDGTAAMLRAAGEVGLTLAIRDRFRGEDHPALRAIPFAPPLRHDVALIWTPAGESALVREFLAGCAAAD